MDKRTEQAGKRAAYVLNGELDANINNKRALVDVQTLEDILAYVKALEEPAETETMDVYLRGDWYVSILKMDLTEEQVRLLNTIGGRTADSTNTIEVQEHKPENPLPNWLGHTRVE